MFRRFIREEEGQGAIEYIILAGGMIIGAIIVFNMYSRMTKSAGNKLEKGTGTVTTSFQGTIETTM